MDIRNNTITATDNVLPAYMEDYSELLDFFGVTYKTVDYYLQVGEVPLIPKWILHLSVVTWQVYDLYKTVVPFLMSANVPFKISMDQETCDNILMGYLGAAQIGKIVNIYPDNDTKALDLAKKLIVLTNQFKGPKILTDICLGNIMYTGYGNEELCTIPFALPKGINWPFKALTNSSPLPTRKILNRIYKPIEILKEDVRGNVYQGIYLKSLFNVTKCVIKQGNMNMASEYSGRTIHDRLAWQQELHHELADSIRLPRIFDLFIEDGDTYLIMEFVKGKSLYDIRKEINPESRSWSDLPDSIALKLVDYMIKIASIIDILHQKGYVHRDIAPGNFLIDKDDNVYPIDLELAYSFLEEKPNPPYIYGTAGFMSPEQREVQTPTIKEDIFGLGALMLTVFSGLTPVKFNTWKPEQLYENLYFFIGHAEIAKLICSCLHFEPKKRPEIERLITILKEYKDELQFRNVTKIRQDFSFKSDSYKLKDIILFALGGLNRPPVITLNDVWYSKFEKPVSFNTPMNKEYARYPGLHKGIVGVLYLLARVKKMTISIDSCTKGYKIGWEYIEENYLNKLPEIAPGLYDGAAGIALALAEGINAGLLDDTTFNRLKIQQCLAIPNKELNLSKGIAGQAVSILQCKSYLPKELVQTMLDQIMTILVKTQQKDGSWRLPPHTEKEKGGNLSFGYGMGGIIWALLAYTEHYHDKQTKNTAIKALQWLSKTTHDLNDLFNQIAFEKILLGKPEVGDERKGSILVFIKAYETLHDIKYKTIVESALFKYPSTVIKNDFNQETGLAGMGEIYLEAARVFKNEEWQQRADWIARLYVHTFSKSSEKTGFWKMEENNDPTADFMIGISGIIHFLLRCLDYEKTGYRLLS